jgi:hypothetical protein
LTKENNPMTASHAKPRDNAKGFASESDSSPILKMQKLAVDAGNRSICAFDTYDRLLNLPSFHIDLEPYDQPQPDPNSVIIEYQNQGSAAKKGKRWAVGKVAQEMGGKATFYEEKAYLAGKLVLAAIQPHEGKRQIVIEKLILCLPNHLQQDKVDAIKAALEGIHQYQRNGIDLTVHVRSIEIQPETLGAYRLAKILNLFNCLDRPNAVLDLGGKTGIGQIYTANGSYPNDGRVIVAGTYDLAKICLKHPNFVNQDTTADLALIMDGIADGSYKYGQTGIYFGDRFEQYREEWIQGIRNQLNTKWERYRAQLGEVLVIGGSAELATTLFEVSKGRFKLPPTECDPQTFSVRGMLING